MTLAERQRTYEKSYDLSLLPKLPIIAKCSIGNFKKMTSKLDKPICNELHSILKNTSLTSSMELNGSIFTYYFQDEIIFVIKSNKDNDSLVYKNNLQKINSIVTCLVSTNFLKNYFASDAPPDLIGEALWETHVFCVPSQKEAINYLIYKQNECLHKSINEIIKTLNFEGNIIDNIIQTRNLEEKIQIVGPTVYSSYDEEFKLGTSSFKIKDEDENHWCNKIIKFVDVKDQLMSVMSNGFLDD